MTLLGLLLLGIASGCQRQLARGPDSMIDPYAAPADHQSAPELAPEAKGFFKPNRLSGAWSGQAAEIEQSLGVPR